MAMTDDEVLALLTSDEQRLWRMGEPRDLLRTIATERKQAEEAKITYELCVDEVKSERDALKADLAQSVRNEDFTTFRKDLARVTAERENIVTALEHAKLQRDTAQVERNAERALADGLAKDLDAILSEYGRGKYAASLAAHAKARPKTSAKARAKASP